MIQGLFCRISPNENPVNKGWQHLIGHTSALVNLPHLTLILTLRILTFEL